MKTETLAYDPDQARELWRSYQKHKHYSTPVDQEIAAIYKQIAQGRTVVRALASIVAAGLYEAASPYANLPKLAISRADAKQVFWRPERQGGRFTIDQWARSNQAASRRVDIPRGMWPSMTSGYPNGVSLLPTVPLHLRPKRGLENYYILWEAEWRPIPPGDPLLLRRIGQADAWLVVAAWDLTPVERAALSTRLNS